MSTVTITQVAVNYRWNVGSLSIYMSADNRTTTLGRHIGRHIGRVSVDILTDAPPICWLIYRATHLGRHIDRHSLDMSTDISIDTRPIYRPICRSTVSRCVERYVGWGLHKIHLIQNFLKRVQRYCNFIISTTKLFYSSPASIIFPAQLLAWYSLCVLLLNYQPN